ncbi:MAG: hypothetical protein DKM50_08460 [Candidatus Margulisiibacteriota bacterium]|nr:MAG: hypothetical protein A2X43_11990 [Candidatus Margulisbacteria bacterium GWD2_39_127]OGI01860.1 MAG: hypothetical protein A2X42_04515 [Candidatus Margulisbacteria bacterium GWF2_38_17]OGI10182.1 MAG: hypothetical protein A2X41_01235 [Candidatus Margulisbacteria bacterium GWE2_39_32]PZM79482.1 MAG: hypothetical protein DKM50_08460 [Candidatus Margulisiibacteriota bacterium]HAR63848.1 hypothetical protein [Candidatus Margulisiibacteriota bacterium]
MNKYRKEIILFVKFFFITLIIYHFMMYLWSNYDSIKPLDIAEYIRILWGDFKRFSGIILFFNILLPMMIAVIFFVREFIKIDSNNISNTSKKSSIIKILIFICSYIFIYFCGPIVFYLIGIPIIILAAMFSIALFLKHLSNKAGTKNS